MPVHQAKIVLALAGLLVFFAGAKLEFAWLRWSGIVLVAAAWLLRFYRKSPHTSSPASSSEDQ